MKQAILLILLLSVSAIFAQEFDISKEVSPSKLKEGDESVVTIAVNLDGVDISKVRIRDTVIAEFEILDFENRDVFECSYKVERLTNYKVIECRILKPKEKYELKYKIKAVEAGVFTFPPASISSDEKMITSKSIPVVVAFAEKPRFAYPPEETLPKKPEAKKFDLSSAVRYVISKFYFAKSIIFVAMGIAAFLAVVGAVVVLLSIILKIK